jgi:hypothetical protein
MISADPVPVGEDSVWILPPQECEMMDHINVEGQGNTFSAYIARPKTSPTSAVVVLQELFGVNADVMGSVTLFLGMGNPHSSVGFDRASIRTEGDFETGIECVTGQPEKLSFAHAEGRYYRRLPAKRGCVRSRCLPISSALRNTIS